MTPLVSLEAVSRRFTLGPDTVTALDQVDLVVEPGELVCVNGASGSGKSTLLNTIAGISVADSGRVSINGTDISALGERKRSDVRISTIAVVFQSDNLLLELTVLENVVLPLLARGVPRREADERAARALQTMSLEPLSRRLPAQLSGGQRQRVGIARALAGGQPLLLADEPTGALDSVASRELFTLLRRACDERGLAVVLATHDPIAREVADRVLEMVDGRLAALQAVVS